MSWVSNFVSIMKKEGIIRMCIYFRDLNKVCPKDNYLTPFIDHVIDSCTNHEALSFMGGFSRYNEIHIDHMDQYKTTFTYQVIPFSLKMLAPPSSET